MTASVRKMDLVSGGSLVLAMILQFAVGCSTTPRTLDPFAGCGVTPERWRSVAVPPERERLLDLTDKSTNTTVRENLQGLQGQKEAWFETSDQTLLLCIYDPIESCLRGDRRTVYFLKSASTWEAGPVVRTICSH
jgi:hypothetical protein